MSVRAVLVAIALIGISLPSTADRAAAQACGTGTYTYQFINHCAQTIWLGQNGPGTASTPAQNGSWALPPNCTADAQCPSGVCHMGGGSRGKCHCEADSDCPGSATCNTVHHKCEIKTTFCMPQAWSSGNFWPRTGCTFVPAGGGNAAQLNCMTGQCGGDPTTQTNGLLDCGAGSGQAGPTPPITLIEMTTSSSSGNYDVSLNNGYNVETLVTARQGTGSTCSFAGCTSDLSFAGNSPQCPANLIFTYTDPTTSATTAAGCYQPLDACAGSGAGTPGTVPAGLMCDEPITVDSMGNAPAATTLCGGGAGSAPTYLDMYQAQNNGDPTSNTQITANGGTPTAWGVEDCPPGSIFATDFVQGAACSQHTPCVAGQACVNGHCQLGVPTGIGVCLRFVNEVLVPNEGCTADNVGAVCGQYAAAYPTTALGYTCQAVKYTAKDGKTKTTYPCVPPTVSGLGACNDTGTTAFYQSTGGLFNASWIEAGIKAGGGTPYYETFKAACPAGYTWQYDDVSGGRACALPGTSDAGFTIEFCASEADNPDTPALSASVLPAARAVQVGTIATAFATIVNSGESAATGCTIAPTAPVPGAAFSFQATDGSTNAPIGPADAPVDIAPSGRRTFVITFAPSAALPPTDVLLAFRCANAATAPIVRGVNTLRLSASTTPVPDIVALAATVQNDGIVHVPGVGGTGVFAVATTNVGAGGEIQVSADTGVTALPVTVTMCKVNALTGACETPLSSTLTTHIGAGETPAFGFFVKANGLVPLDHAASRLFVRFTHQGALRGLTSVSVHAQ